MMDREQSKERARLALSILSGRRDLAADPLDDGEMLAFGFDPDALRGAGSEVVRALARERAEALILELLF